MYVCTPRKHLKELLLAPEQSLSFVDLLTHNLQIKYTFHESIVRDHFHVPIVKAELTKNIPALMPDIVDELTSALTTEIPPTDGTSLFDSLSRQIGCHFEYLKRLRGLSQGSVTVSLLDCLCVCSYVLV
jgi:hypothetical protein